MSYDISIIEQACPYCENTRTARVQHSGLEFCFRCHRNWKPAAEPDFEAYAFTEAELARLEHYRAAVCAGYYTDLVI